MHDLDDYLACAMDCALIGQAGLNAKFVHIDVSCHIGANDATRSGIMWSNVTGAISRWGLTVKAFDDQTSLTESVNDLAAEINASSASNVFYLACAGPMEVPWRGINAANSSARQFCTAISHAVWNDTHADTTQMTHTWTSIQSSGVKAVHIASQGNPNGFDQAQSAYSWLQTSSNPNWQWLFSKNVKSNFDASDSGMIWYIITGRGDQNPTVTNVHAVFDGNFVYSGSSAPVITSPTTASGTVGTAFSYTITATSSPTSYAASGLPAGLSVNTSTGVISGTPTTAGTSSVTISATNANGTGSATLSLTITPPGGGLPSPWVQADVGTVGTAGSGTYAGSTFTVKGAGSDIGGTVDSFHYVNQTLAGDGSLIVRLASETQGGTANDKVGIMIRESTANNSAMVGVFLDSSSATVRLVSRAATGGSAVWVNGSTGVSAPRWFKLVRATNSFTGFVSSDGVTWTAVGSAVSVTMASNVTMGMAVCSRDTTTLNTSTFDNVTASGTSTVPAITSATTASGTVGTAFSYTITATNSPTSYDATGLPAGLSVDTSTGVISGTPTAAGTSSVTISATNAGGTGTATLTLTVNTAGGLPSPWVQADVGTVGTAGSGTYAGSTFTVKGAGSDIGGTADSFHYVNQTLAGDGSLVVRLATETLGGTANDKVGIMIRESTANNSTMVGVILDSSSSTVRLVSRAATGGSAVWVNGSTGVSAPRWFKLVRATNSFTGFVSSDGVTWTAVGSAVSVTMASNVTMGMAVCSRDTASLNTSTFDNVTATP